MALDIAAANGDHAPVHRPEDIPLAGGISTPGVVRVGDTVRRPLKPDADGIHALLTHFERRGFEGAPRFLSVDARGRAMLSFVEGFAPPHNGFRLSEEGARSGGRLARQVHGLTEGAAFAAGSEVACHPNLSQPNFVFRDTIPVAILDWDGTRLGTRLANLGEFLWAFVHPAVYGWSGHGLVDAMLAAVRGFQAVAAGDRAAMAWGRAELAYMERNADVLLAYLPD